MLVLVFLVFGTLHAAAPPESNRSYHQQPVGQPAVDESRHAEEPRRVLEVIEPRERHHDEKELEEEDQRPLPLKRVVKWIHKRASPLICRLMTTEVALPIMDAPFHRRSYRAVFLP